MGSLTDALGPGHVIQVMINGIMVDDDRLVLINPDSREQVERLRSEIFENTGIGHREFDRVQTALRRIARPLGSMPTESKPIMRGPFLPLNRATMTDSQGVHEVALIDPEDIGTLLRLAGVLSRWGYDFIWTPDHFDPKRDGSCLMAALREFMQSPTTQESPMPEPEYERPDPGTWVQVWAQVSKDQKGYPEDVLVGLESHNEQYTAYVRLDRIRLAEEPPAFAEQCTHLANDITDPGVRMWRCVKYARHAGDHSNGGDMIWSDKKTVGHFEEA